MFYNSKLIKKIFSYLIVTSWGHTRDWCELRHSRNLDARRCLLLPWHSTRLSSTEVADIHRVLKPENRTDIIVTFPLVRPVLYFRERWWKGTDLCWIYEFGKRALQCLNLPLDCIAPQKSHNDFCGFNPEFLGRKANSDFWEIAWQHAYSTVQELSVNRTVTHTLEEESDCCRLSLNTYTLLSFKAMVEAVADCIVVWVGVPVFSIPPALLCYVWSQMALFRKPFGIGHMFI
jgi:hypothetical protein